MSKYTTELRYICESYAGERESKGGSSVEDIIERARPHIFDFEYPIFKEEYRPILERKIIQHFYTREIGAETAGLWKMWLRTRMNEIMPYYNKLYEADLKEFDPLHDVDLWTIRDTDTGVVGTDSYTNVTSPDLWNEYSDTPQGGLDGVRNLRYLTNATHDSGSTTSNGNANRNSTTETDFNEHMYGKTAGHTYAKLLIEYRESIINIDMMVIKELNDLFINLW